MAKFLGKGIGSGVSIFATVVLWAASMTLVFDENYATSDSADLSDISIGKSGTDEFQTWMNVTMGSDKIGYTVQSLTDTPLGYILKDYSLIKIPMGGVVREVYLDSYAVLKLDYSLKNFTFGLVSGEYTTDVFGEMRDDKLIVKMRSGNSESAATFDAGKGIYLPAVVPLLARARGFPEGEFTLPTFDPFSLITDDLEIFIGPEENVKTDLGDRLGHRVTIGFSGVTSYMWVDDKGRVLRQEETGGMAMVQTDKERALFMPAFDGNGRDLLIELAVPCNGDLKDPRDLEYLKVEIEGIEPEFFDLDDDFQTVVSTDPLVLEIHPHRLKPSVLEDSAAFLSPQLFLQVDDPRIVRAAENIIDDVTDPSVKAGLIGQWVYENIEKDLTISLPSAVDVLEVRKGDCNEHTVLYTALARSTGLPTKICIGIVYNDGYFYYHAWPAVFLGSWLPIDPTLGQDVADATHIKLLEGGLERQADLMRVVGKISVTVLDYSYGEPL
jgi:hypothetical protein